MAAIDQKLKRKYQVFISSTFSDLAEERREAVFGVTKAGHFALALENSGPEAESKIDVIRKSIAESQYYVIILGHRYGSVAPGQPSGSKKSYVELELEYAESINKDDKENKKVQVLAFVMPEKKVQKIRNALRRPQDAAELANEEQYWELYQRLTSSLDCPFYRLFNTPTDIYVELFGYFSRDHEKVRGYVPEPVQKEDVDIFRISAKNEILREVIQRLGQFTFVDPRLNVAKEKKLALATAFRQLHGDHIRDKWKKVFIESGSTLAYIARDLAPKLPRMGAGHSARRLITNNSIAYLYLWLCSQVLCHPEPEGPPDNKYGAMFGDLTDFERVPDYRQPSLEVYDPDAVELIQQMSKSIFGEPGSNSHSILLAAASALQLSDDIKVDDDAPIPEGLKDCRGFHGGSYQNRLFKRCMYESKIPAFFFMDDTKIDIPIRPGICHFLCDRGYPWDEFIREYPMSIWIACEKSTLQRIQEKVRERLKDGGWLTTIYAEATTPIVMATNEAFRDSCKKIGVTV